MLGSPGAVRNPRIPGGEGSRTSPKLNCRGIGHCRWDGFCREGYLLHGELVDVEEDAHDQG